MFAKFRNVRNFEKGLVEFWTLNISNNLVNFEYLPGG